MTTASSTAVWRPTGGREIQRPTKSNKDQTGGSCQCSLCGKDKCNKSSCPYNGSFNPHSTGGKAPCQCFNIKSNYFDKKSGLIIISFMIGYLKENGIMTLDKLLLLPKLKDLLKDVPDNSKVINDLTKYYQIAINHL